MTSFTYSRPGTNSAQVSGNVTIDTAGIEAKLETLTCAILNQQVVIEMPEIPEREEPEININVSPVVVARIEWEALADALLKARPIVNVQPPAHAPISLSSSPVVMQGNPELIWGVYAIAFILACMFMLGSFVVYLNCL